MGLFEKVGLRVQKPAAALLVSHNQQRDNKPQEKDRTELEKVLAPGWLERHENISQQLYETCKDNDWFELCPHEPSFAIRSGLSMSAYSVLPQSSANDSRLQTLAAFCQFDVGAMMSTPLVKAIMEDVPLDIHDIVLPSNRHIQIIESLSNYRMIKRDQMAAFVRDQSTLLIWSQQIENLIPEIRRLEDNLLEMVAQNSHNESSDSLKDKLTSSFRITETALSSTDDLERCSGDNVRYGQSLVGPISVAMVILLLCYFIGELISGVLASVLNGGTVLQFAILLYIPILVFLSSFFANVVVGCILQLVGPTSQMKTNSKYYSAQRPKMLATRLPHITIQCPVYKEDLAEVIRPTVRSVREAITTYEQQGGTANLFINDDGFQVISKTEAEFRREFYRNNGVGWLSRPGESDTFKRVGKFKKGSNMNFCLDISLRVERVLEGFERGPDWTDLDEARAQEEALARVLAEDGNIGIGEGNVRIGELILIIDSDTRVPRDCFLDAANEFAETPELAILQNCSGVMQVTHDFWENSLAYFTRNIYFSIQYACAAGDVAAFVGHNAYLRWSALQEVLYEEEGKMKWWSENHVSEDFIMSLKLQMKGYITRLAVYHGDDYKEGVALTVYDELSRWTKYAYGCSELCWQPLKYWFTKGPMTPLFWTFLRSNMRPQSKFNIISYIGTYYSIASALWMTIINFLLNGWYAIYLQNDFRWYNDSFTIFIAVTVVFLLVAPITNAVLKYRLGYASFFGALFENVKYCLVFTIFLGGLSYHLTVGLVQHMFSLEVSWGATAKSISDSDFFTELPIIWNRFKKMYAFLLVIILAMIAFAYAPLGPWSIANLPGQLSLGWIVAAHGLMPLIFNPKSYLEEMHGEIALSCAYVYKQFTKLVYETKNSRFLSSRPQNTRSGNF